MPSAGWHSPGESTVQREGGAGNLWPTLETTDASIWLFLDLIASIVLSSSEVLTEVLEPLAECLTQRM